MLKYGINWFSSRAEQTNCVKKKVQCFSIVARCTSSRAMIKSGKVVEQNWPLSCNNATPHCAAQLPRLAEPRLAWIGLRGQQAPGCFVTLDLVEEEVRTYQSCQSFVETQPLLGLKGRGAEYSSLMTTFPMELMAPLNGLDVQRQKLRALLSSSAKSFSY